MEATPRNIAKIGQLQIKVRRKGGTLLRRKKYVYDELEWVALCVHDSKVPLLEWYPTKDHVFNHEPSRVQDLLDCMFVNAAFDDDRCFLIGFCDEKRQPLEFSAINTEQCNEWVVKLCEILRSLNCLGEAENVYMEFKQPAPHCQSFSSGSTALHQNVASPSTSLSFSPPPLPRRPANLTKTKTLFLTDEIPMSSDSSSSTTPMPSAHISGEAVTTRPEIKKSSVSTINGTNDWKKGEGPTETINCSPQPPSEPIECVSRSSLSPISHSVGSASDTLRQLLLAGSPPSSGDSPVKIIAQQIHQKQQVQLAAGRKTEEPIPPLPPRKQQSLIGVSLSATIGFSSKIGRSVDADDGTEKTLARNQYDLLDTIPSAINYDQLSNAVVYHQEENIEPLTTQSTDSTTSASIYNQLNFAHPNTNSHGSGSQTKSSCGTSSASERASTISDEACRLRLSNSGGGVSSPDSSRASTSSEFRRCSKAGDVVTGSGGGGGVDSVYDMTFSQIQQIAATVNYSNNSGVQAEYDYLPATTTSPTPLITNSFNSTFAEALSKPRTISLALTLCVEHIAFIEVGRKIWIAGWNPEKDSLLKNLIHFGDEVVQIGKELVTSIAQIPSSFYTQSLPGTPIEVKVRSIPNGSVYSITKPLNPKKSLGIVLHKKKNQIASIENNSAAFRAKVPSRVTPYIYGGASEVAAVITELDGIPLNPFAANEQLFQRFERVVDGATTNLIVHPSDLVKLFKQELKTRKNWKRFVHDN